MSNEPISQQAGAPTIRVLAQYAKSITFSSKDGYQVSAQEKAPNIEIGVDLQSAPTQGQDRVFETVLKLMGRAHVDNDPVFEIELAYAGIFDLGGAHPDHVEPILMIDCPMLLFPFARRVIADTTREGGFPPLLIDPIDFNSLYQQQLQRSASGSTS